MEALLRENEALRMALKVSDKVATTKETQKPVVVPKTQVESPPLETVARTPRVLNTEDRKRALERYRCKRQRRIAKTAHLRGPKFMKYTKMKEAANAKRRNSEGKFIKKADLEKMLTEEIALVCS